MSNFENHGRLGFDLANRLGLQLPRREGHDLAGCCIACKSSDAFRLHQANGVGHCYSCQGKWSPFQVAEEVLGDREKAKAIMIELGHFSTIGYTGKLATDPLTAIALQKGVSVESLMAFGAHGRLGNEVEIPAYGPNGKACTTFTLSVNGGKGLLAKGRPAGLYFPHIDDAVLLPKPGETWHLVEGPKDAAALHDLGLRACGLNTCRLAPKFSRLFLGVNVVLIPDRDRAGEEGSQATAKVLRGVADSVRIAVLPTEFKETKGDDVRDVLRRRGGKDLVLQAIADAQPLKESIPAKQGPSMQTSSADIALASGETLKLAVHPARKQPQRVVVARCGDIEHRDRVDTNSSVSRSRFIRNLERKCNLEPNDLLSLVDSRLTELADEIDGQCANGEEVTAAEDQSQATLLASMAAEWELWHTPGREGFVTFPRENHKESWPIRSQTFRHYLSKRFFDQTGKALNADAASSAINLFEAKAIFDGHEVSVHVRVAEHDDKFFIDLCNDVWQAVEVSERGWRIVDEPPVRFRRSRGMLALPTPERGGNVELLRDFLNVDDDAWRLILSWVVATLRPRGPYPILALVAEQGSGKSTVGRMIRRLVDPSSAPLRAEPNSERELMIAANNSWCLAFDNLSSLKPGLSDALCRLSTGGGFTARELFTNQDEIIFDSQRPILLTSIEDVATRSDLLDRSLLVMLPTIPEDRRRPESEMIQAFDAARPRILGAILDAISVAIRRLPSIKPSSLPRMADFALWATAAEDAFGWEPETFVETYRRNRTSVNDIAIDAQVIAEPLLQLLNELGRWEGAATELLKALEERLGDKVRRITGWPKNAQSLSGHLSRIAPNLRASGWTIDKGRNSQRRSWVIFKAEVERPGEPSHVPSSCDSDEWMQHDEIWREATNDDANDANDAFDYRSRQRLPD